MKIIEDTQYKQYSLHFNGFRAADYTKLQKLPETVPSTHLSSPNINSEEHSVISVQINPHLSAENGLDGTPFYVRGSYEELQIAQNVHEEEMYYMRTGDGEDYKITSHKVMDILNKEIMQKEELSYTLEVYPLSTLGLLESYSSDITQIGARLTHISDEWLVKTMGEPDLITYFL